MSDDSIRNDEDLIDSRDVIARLAYLAGQWSAHANDPSAPELDADEVDELKALTALAEEASSYADDWAYGETLIRDSYFQEYAEQLADELGLVDDSARWPSDHIDWPAAARALQMDYTSVDFDGVTYWIR